jgi:LmbE family N-acetylglucosaminyl deacetylase
VHRIATRRRVAAVLLSLAGWLVASEGAAQTGSSSAQKSASRRSSTGSVETGLLLRQLDGVKRVLLIGAHPDDEDTALLAALARGLGAQAAYLSLTRGEGGQNLIGPELGEGLGLVRTGELLAARSLDGGHQYFTRAYDFGYSKSASETFGHWPRDSLLRDVVWVVRTFRPQIIVSIFAGDPRDGHGQHQVAGLLAREAFDVAGDPERFPELASRGALPWQPLKLYRTTWRDPQNSTLTLATGQLDPLLGRSHHQVAMASRSQHRSQDFGTAQAPGPQLAHLRLLESRVPGPDTSMFAGIDTTLAGLGSALAGPLRDGILRGLARYRAQLDSTRASLNALSPWEAAPPLAEALRVLRELRDRLVGVPAEPAPVASGQSTVPLSGPARSPRSEPGTPNAERVGSPTYSLLRALDDRILHAEEALLASASIVLEPRSDDDLVVRGQTVDVKAGLWNGGPFELEVERVALVPHPGSGRAAGDGSRRLPPASLHTWSFDFRIPADAALSQPYYLVAPRTGDLYRWPDRADTWARPTATAPVWVQASLWLKVDSVRIPLDVWRPVRYRGLDKASGEFWRPVQVVPALSVRITPEVVAWPAGDTSPRTLSVTVRSEAEQAVEGSLRLEVPAGWGSLPERQAFALPVSGSQITLAFTIRPESGGGATPFGPSGPSDPVELRAVATIADGQSFDRRLSMIDYSHIEPAVFLEFAITQIRRFPVEVVRRPLGYIMGSGDAVPEAIRQLGVDVEVLDPSGLNRQNFDRFDVLVLGVRSYEVLPELAAANVELLDWVGRGGVLIVQYNKYEFSDGQFAPYPIVLRQPAGRVTDERSSVRLLEPGSPALSTPNRIMPEDFDGWVQERGLYIPSEWSEQYVPLLETGDPEEEPGRGSLLVGSLGDGLYVYTSLSFFRQLPAGVPGAFRLLANILSLDPAAWRAYLTGVRQVERAGP